MATLLEPMAGKVEIDGWDVTIDPQAVRKVIGYMPDHAGVYERVTVREYLEFFADAYQVPTAGTTYAVVDAVMELTDLTKLRDKLVATMSKGMKQRLQLARTLLHDPKVLILDEPASDLDPRARIEIRDLLVELRSMGKTIFLSSHILTELADVCTSVAILERGRLVVSGPISDIARRLETAQAQMQQAPPPLALGPAQTGAPSEWAAPEPPPAPAVVAPTRNVRIKALAPGEAVYAALVSMQGIHSVSPGPAGSVVVKYAGDEQMVAGIVRALVLAGIPVVGVEPERNELERIFLEVTKGEVQ
jgi:ABC-2 type transport system ATP-binding protein